tara:strand:- start:96 stop:485 length:390 start_codon:yes stop_codon:yes gene_type:complete
MKTENKLDKLKTFLGTLNSEIDLPYFADEDTQTFEDLREAIENGGGFDIEIIYYSRAIEYLQNNDASLRESLSIAADLGYEVSNLSSEVLASLLASQNARSEFEDLESEISTFLDELNEEEEEEEEEEA